jgi:hypothetical protein
LHEWDFAICRYKVPWNLKEERSQNSTDQTFSLVPDEKEHLLDDCSTKETNEEIMVLTQPSTRTSDAVETRHQPSSDRLYFK